MCMPQYILERQDVLNLTINARDAMPAIVGIDHGEAAPGEAALVHVDGDAVRRAARHPARARQPPHRPISGP